MRDQTAVRKRQRAAAQADDLAQLQRGRARIEAKGTSGLSPDAWLAVFDVLISSYTPEGLYGAAFVTRDVHSLLCTCSDSSALAAPVWKMLAAKLHSDHMHKFTSPDWDRFLLHPKAFKVPQLKALLKDAGCIQGGCKEHLVSRCLQAISIGRLVPAAVHAALVHEREGLRLCHLGRSSDLYLHVQCILANLQHADSAVQSSMAHISLYSHVGPVRTALRLAGITTARSLRKYSITMQHRAGVHRLHERVLHYTRVVLEMPMSPRSKVSGLKTLLGEV